MRTKSVSLSDIEFNKFSFKNDTVSFTDFLYIVSKEVTCQNLNKCIELAEKCGIQKQCRKKLQMK